MYNFFVILFVCFRKILYFCTHLTFWYKDSFAEKCISFSCCADDSAYLGSETPNKTDWGYPLLQT